MDEFLRRLSDSVTLDSFVEGLFEHFNDLIVDHWSKLLFLLLGAIIFWLFRRWRDHREYLTAQFNSQVIVTLTTIRDGTLNLFTLDAPEIDRVFRNQMIKGLVVRAAAKTTVEDPVLRFQAEKDRQLAYMSVVNHVSGLFRDGLVALAVGRPVEAIPFLLALTWERDGDLVTQKLRVMAVARQSLLDWPDAMPALLKPYHAIRHRTMLALKRTYLEKPTEFAQITVSVPR